MIAEQINVTAEQLEILAYLAKWRFATTKHIHQELESDKYRKHTSGNLQRLCQLKLIRSFRVQPEKGTNSELGFLITRNGAKKLGIAWSNKYDRQPSRERLHYRDLELELPRLVDFASPEWQLLTPVIYSPSKPLPKQTVQSFAVREAIEAAEKARIKQGIISGKFSENSQSYLDYVESKHLWSLPAQLNDYVAIYRPAAPLLTVVLILVDPQNGVAAWLERIKKYEKISKYLPVLGIFENETSKASGEELIQELTRKERNKRLITGFGAKFKVITLAEVYDELGRLAASKAWSQENAFAYQDAYALPLLDKSRQLVREAQTESDFSRTQLHDYNSGAELPKISINR